MPEVLRLLSTMVFAPRNKKINYADRANSDNCMILIKPIKSFDKASDYFFLIKGSKVLEKINRFLNNNCGKFGDQINQ